MLAINCYTNNGTFIDLNPILRCETASLIRMTDNWATWYEFILLFRVLFFRVNSSSLLWRRFSSMNSHHWCHAVASLWWRGSRKIVTPSWLWHDNTNDFFWWYSLLMILDPVTASLTSCCDVWWCRHMALSLGPRWGDPGGRATPRELQETSRRRGGKKNNAIDWKR